MKYRAFSILVLVFALSLLAVSARADTAGIGTAAPFAVLGEAGVTNTGSSTIYGSVAGSTGTPALTGFGSATVVLPGVLIPGGVGAGAGTPFGDATFAYNNALSSAATPEGTAQLGTGGLLSLNPGVYSFTSSTLNLNGTLMLNAMGSDSASWTFQIPNILTVNGASTVEIVNAGGNGPFTGSITWAVGDAATFSGLPSTFLGTIISDGASPDTLTSGDTIGCGRVISLVNSVTLINDTIAIPDCTVAGAIGGTGGTVVTSPLPTPISTPEPGEFVLLSTGLLAMAFLTFRKSRVSSLN
jgi:Ice-binding-like